MASALLDSDSDSSLPVLFPGSWSNEGWHRWTLQRLKSPVSLFQLCQFHVLKNPLKPFGNHSLNSATGISDTMECNSTLFKSSHHSLLTVSQGCCYNLQHSPLKQAATGIHIFFRVYLNFLVIFCATSKITFETHLSDL